MRRSIARRVVNPTRNVSESLVIVMGSVDVMTAIGETGLFFFFFRLKRLTNISRKLLAPRREGRF
jgi:hypothetical protein